MPRFGCARVRTAIERPQGSRGGMARPRIIHVSDLPLIVRDQILPAMPAPRRGDCGEWRATPSKSDDDRGSNASSARHLSE